MKSQRVTGKGVISRGRITNKCESKVDKTRRNMRCDYSFQDSF